MTFRNLEIISACINGDSTVEPILALIAIKKEAIRFIFRNKSKYGIKIPNKNEIIKFIAISKERQDLYITKFNKEIMSLSVFYEEEIRDSNKDEEKIRAIDDKIKKLNTRLNNVLNSENNDILNNNNDGIDYFDIIPKDMKSNIYDMLDDYDKINFSIVMYKRTTCTEIINTIRLLAKAFNIECQNCYEIKHINYRCHRCDKSLCENCTIKCDICNNIIPNRQFRNINHAHNKEHDLGNHNDNAIANNSNMFINSYPCVCISNVCTYCPNTMQMGVIGVQYGQMNKIIKN